MAEFDGTISKQAGDEGREVIGVPNVDQPASPVVTIGRPGYASYSGYIITNESDSRLQGATLYTTYSEMLANTTIVGAGVRYFVNLVAKASWNVVPADDSEEAEHLAEVVETTMHAMRTPWHRIVRRAAMFRFWGYSVQEWTMRLVEEWEREKFGGATLVYKDIEPRPQRTIERWDVDIYGNVEGVVQRSVQTGKEIWIPRDKLVYLVDDTLNDSPEGLGLFRHIIKTAKKLERFELLEAWGMERDLRGTPVARGPLSDIESLNKQGTITASDVTALKSPLETWVSNALRGKDTGLFLDSATYRAKGDNQQPSQTYQWDIQLLQGEGGPHEEVAAAIERMNREIARVLGVEQLLLGSDSKGSHALAQDKTQSFGLLVDSTLREVRETFEKDFLDPLWELNGWDPALKPTFQTSQAQYRDITDITTALKDMAQAGAPLSPNDPAINEVRDLLGLSDQPEVEEMDPMLTLPAPEPQPEDDTPQPDDSQMDDDELEKVLVKPKRGEKKGDFVARFMGSDLARREFPDKDQRLAVAFETWRRKK